MILFFLPSPAPTRRGAGQDWLQPTAGAPARLDMSVTTVTNLIGKIYVSSGAGTAVHSTNTSSGSQSRLFSLWPKGHRRKWAEPCRTNAPLLHWCSRSGLYVQTPSSRSGLQRHKHTHRSYCPHTRSAVTLYSYSYSDDPFSIGRGSAWKRKRSVLMMTLLSGSITMIRNTMTCS